MLSRRELVAGGLASLASLVLAGRKSKEIRFEQLLELARREKWAQLDVAQITARCGLALAGTPYVAATLEIDDDHETCVVRLDGLDCVTFYEAALGFARMLRSGGDSLKEFTQAITTLRYRDGHISGYLSRLHYTSDWIYDNARRRTVADLTPTLPGALQLDKAIDFMSHHQDAYRQLRAHPEWVTAMAAIERRITARRPWYVPNEKVEAIEGLLRSGDIVGIATRLEGLDCSHTGLVYVDAKGVRRFLNASSVHKEVVLGERLSEYARKYSRNLGMMIARPLEPSVQA